MKDKLSSPVAWVFAIVVFVLFSFLVLGQRIFLEGDSVKYFYPYAYLFQTHASAWTPNILGGFSLPATFQFGFFSPLFLLAYRGFNFITGFNLLVLVYILLTLVFTYLFARSLEISPEGSAIVALAFSLSQMILWDADNRAVLGSFMVLPLAFLCVRKFFQGQWAYVFALAGVSGLAWLSAHYQWILYSLISAGCYALWLAWSSRKQGGFKWSPLAWFCLSVIGGVLIAFPQFFYAWKFTSLSVRSGGIDFSDSVSRLATLPLDFIRYIFPAFNLRSLNSQDFFAYVGALPFVLGLFSLRFWRKDKEVGFFSLVVIFCLVVSLKYSPLGWLMIKLPVLKYFRDLSRWMVVGAFAVAVLAGKGFDYFQIEPHQFERPLRFFQKILAWFTGLIVILNLGYWAFGSKVVAYAQHWFDVHRYAQSTHLDLGYYHAAIAKSVSQAFDNISLLRLDFLLPLVFLISAYVILRYVRSGRTFSLLVLFSVSLNLLLSGYLRFTFAGPELITKKPELASYIQSRESSPENYRTFSFLTGFASSQTIGVLPGDHSQDMFRFLVDGLSVNSNLFWNIPSIDGYEPIASQRSEKISNYLGSETSQLGGSLADDQLSLEDKITTFTDRLPLLSMLNVKYIVSPYSLSSPNLALVKSINSTQFKIPLYLYENKNVLPKIYLANSIKEIGPDEKKSFDVITQAGIDFKQTSFIECPNCTEKNIPSANDKLEVDTNAPGLMMSKASVAQGRWLIFSEANLPGWSVSIDGKPVSVYTANYLFQAIYVPAGQHNVIFKYQGIL